MIVHWPWLERKTRAHPGLGLALSVALLVVALAVLLTAWDEPARRSGLPLGLVAAIGVVVFAVAAFLWARRMKRARRND